MTKSGDDGGEEREDPSPSVIAAAASNSVTAATTASEADKGKNQDTVRINENLKSSEESGKEESPSSREGDGTAPREKVGAGARKPMVLLVVGMAGSGKTSLMRRLNSYLLEKGKKPYLVNLDPAVSSLGYEPNIDIRDTVEYKEVMRKYQLGPNGAIVTSLNLFATKFDQALGFIEKRADEGVIDYVLVDTPGQIEVFTWSASGDIITQTLASSFPTALVYVVDTARTTSPSTFMSNMLYACSILYKAKLPFLLAFNKVDVVSWEFAREWMSDFEAFQTALDGAEDCYMTSLIRSMSLALEDFYHDIAAVGVSAFTGKGMHDFFRGADALRLEYEQEYLVELTRKREEVRAKRKVREKEEIAKVRTEIETEKRNGSTAAAEGNAVATSSSNSAPASD